MSFTNVPVLEQIRARVDKTLRDGIQLNMSTDESKKLLKRHLNKKTNVVIMFIDINNSTEMSLLFCILGQAKCRRLEPVFRRIGNYLFCYSIFHKTTRKHHKGLGNLAQILIISRAYCLQFDTILDYHVGKN